MYFSIRSKFYLRVEVHFLVWPQMLLTVNNCNIHDKSYQRQNYSYCHRWRKITSIIRLKPRASGIPCQCSNHWAVETLYINWLSSIWIQCDIFSLLKKFIPQFYVKQKKCGNQIFMECGNYWVNVTNVKCHVSTRTWTQCLGRNVP